MLYKYYLLFLTMLFIGRSYGQQVEQLTSGEPVSIRGLSVVSDDVIWVSGSRGKVGRSVNGGANWTWMQVPGYEKREFRDIEALDSNTAIILAISEPGAILKTSDGGLTWKTVYADSSKGVFMDAFHFEGPRGTVIGDPLDGTIYLAATNDHGNTWRRIQNTPAVDTGEACFASSGFYFQWQCSINQTWQKTGNYNSCYSPARLPQFGGMAFRAKPYNLWHIGCRYQ
ncbi:MAG: hypothetical protein EOO04_11525 [Chitinophagaceae bacterium]|nr:MAG: hypothetical protein EOO04_11525 [Chitinophagaceae bacterium]